MADYVALTQIGLPDPESPEQQITYERGDRLTLEADDEDTAGLLAKGAIQDAAKWDAAEERAHKAQFGESGDVDRQVVEAAAAERRQAEVLSGIHDNIRSGAVVQEVQVPDPDEGAVVFSDHVQADEPQGNAAEQPPDQAPADGPDTGSGDHTQGEPTGGGEKAQGDTKPRPPKRSIAQLVEQRRRDH